MQTGKVSLMRSFLRKNNFGVTPIRFLIFYWFPTKGFPLNP